MIWSEFEASCPKLARRARERFEQDQLAMLGTLTRDGFPRISPCEVDFAAGHLFLGMMWKSPKALDLQRDPKVVVHSVTCNKDGTDGDFKLYGKATEITDSSLREQFRRAIKERIDWAPDEPHFHLFSVDVERAGFIVFNDGRKSVASWTPEAGYRESARTEI